MGPRGTRTHSGLPRQPLVRAVRHDHSLSTTRRRRRAHRMRSASLGCRTHRHDAGPIAAALTRSLHAAHSNAHHWDPHSNWRAAGRWSALLRRTAAARTRIAADARHETRHLPDGSDVSGDRSPPVPSSMIYRSSAVVCNGAGCWPLGLLPPLGRVHFLLRIWPRLSRSARWCVGLVCCMTLADVSCGWLYLGVRHRSD